MASIPFILRHAVNDALDRDWANAPCIITSGGVRRRRYSFFLFLVLLKSGETGSSSPAFQVGRVSAASAAPNEFFCCVVFMEGRGAEREKAP